MFNPSVFVALYIAVSHIKKSSADSASNQLNDSAKALIKEFNKDARKQARKDNKKTVSRTSHFYAMCEWWELHHRSVHNRHIPIPIVLLSF